ncbi:fibroleukin-like isoform X1 [Drosophila takahashii]|uniref:fibroleukin-like isoform X1 n=1 Tax=Drosophila takahashii TaxID=29030 RepID=UPI003898D9D3
MRKNNMESEDMDGSSTSEESSPSSGKKDVNNTSDKKLIQSLRKKINKLEEKLEDSGKNQKATIKLYEDSLKDKNDLIKSLNTIIDLMKETKELRTIQSQQIAPQNGVELQKGNFTSNEMPNHLLLGSNLSDSAHCIEDFQTLQKELEESQSQNASLSDKISKLDSEIIGLKSQLEEMENSLEMSKADEAHLRYQIIELKSNSNLHAANSKEKDDRLLKYIKQCEQSQVRNASLTDKILKLDLEIIDLKSKLMKKEKDLAISKMQSKADKDKLISRIIELNPSAKIDAITNDKPKGFYEQHLGMSWMLILHRFNGSLNFNTFDIFNVIGSASKDKEFFLGFDKLHNITKSRRHELLIELEDFNNKKAYARYDNFVVGSKAKGYALESLGSYSGNAGDALRNHEKCAVTFKVSSVLKKKRGTMYG